MSRLTTEQREQVKNYTGTAKEATEEFGISIAYVYKIWNGRLQRQAQCKYCRNEYTVEYGNHFHCSVMCKMLSLIDKTKDCWVWRGHTNTDGYGMFQYKANLYTAHRKMYELTTNIKIPLGMCILHSCDNPPCVNPDHLRIGTHKDNAQDRMERNRHPDQTGSNNFCAKLTEDKVLAIRADTRKQREIAKEYGVVRQTVSDIKLRRSWTHI